MDSQKNLILVALKSMEYESIKAGDKAMERCLGGCLRSLRATTKVIAKLEHLSGIKGFTRSMIALIGETFEKGPIRCDCGKKNKSLADLKIHLKSHLKKKVLSREKLLCLRRLLRTRNRVRMQRRKKE